MGTSFKVLLLRRFTGLAPGMYSFHGWAADGGGETSLRLFARDCGGPAMSTAMVSTGQQNWKQFTLKCILVKKGECTLGLHVDAPADTWGNIDHQLRSPGTAGLADRCRPCSSRCRFIVALDQAPR